MLKYQAIYHLHICKTGGRWFNQYIAFSLFNYLKFVFFFKIINKKHSNSDLNYSHFGWHPLIDDNTFVVSGIREPVSQICSLYIDSNKIRKVTDKTKENFFIEIFDKKINLYKNNQSKHFYYSQKIRGYGVNLLAEGENYKETSLSRAKLVNYFYIQKENMDNKIIIDEILNQLDIENPNTLSPELQIKKVGDNPASKILYDMLNDEEKELIINKLADIDIEIYKIALKKMAKTDKNQI